ncbi:PE-PGRS family protein PE_PGRS26-like [Schistocerca piceifrons]|uniref:PE-PGRS family protein PE_PGRS26-like n=1 Tax=Schistocerca piceifrons TaxID=274613 RepID=UPI001F5F331F|nr:PE-PGRS family protein PE_PGRS26-like [Schistocerca piceifrons]
MLQMSVCLAAAAVWMVAGTSWQVLDQDAAELLAMWISTNQGAAAVAWLAVGTYTSQDTVACIPWGGNVIARGGSGSGGSGGGGGVNGAGGWDMLASGSGGDGGVGGSV